MAREGRGPDQLLHRLALHFATHPQQGQGLRHRVSPGLRAWSYRWSAHARVAAAVRADLGREPLGAIVDAYGRSYWDKPKGSGMREHLSTTAHAEEVLTAAGVSTDYAAALDDKSWDPMLNEETELALSRTGRDVGTPIITYQPPDGLSFFGPVISRVPNDEDAVPLWDAVTTLAAFPGFAEMKRSMREVPQLNILGGVSDEPGREDWTGGHRAGHLASDSDQPVED